MRAEASAKAEVADSKARRRAAEGLPTGQGPKDRADGNGGEANVQHAAPKATSTVHDN